MTHQPALQIVAPPSAAPSHIHLAACACGWTGGLHRTETTARTVAARHARTPAAA